MRLAWSVLWVLHSVRHQPGARRLRRQHGQRQAGAFAGYGRVLYLPQRQGRGTVQAFEGVLRRRYRFAQNVLLYFVDDWLL